MKAAFHTGEKEMTVRDVTIPEPGDEEYLVRIKACGICGSDTWWSKEARPDEPLHGHEAAGIIVNAGKNATKFKAGDRVVCYAILGCGECPQCRIGKPTACTKMQYIEHGFAEYGVYHERMLFPCPDEFDFVTASMLSDAIGVPLHGLNRLPAAADDKVIVWGLGPLGLLQVLFLKASGVKTIIGMDMVESRRTKALEYGAAYAFDPTAADTKANVMELTDGLGADKSYTYVRNDKATVQVFEYARVGSSICTFVGLGGSYQLGEYFERSLIWSFYFTPDEFAQNVEFLRGTGIDLRQCVSHIFPLEKIQEAFEMRFEHQELSTKIVITMD